MKKSFTIFFLIAIVQLAQSQPTAGTTGLLNIPTAEMQQDGTFMFGTSLLPRSLTPEHLNYNTWSYFVNITFLPLLEVSYRCTLLKMKNTGRYTNQDRSVSVRLRLFKEQKNFPSVLIGGNDVITSSESGNQYFGATYLVLSKDLKWGKSQISLSFGYGFKILKNDEIKGVFGGIKISPSFFKHLELMTEYDSNAFNTGGAINLFNHFKIVVFAYDMKYLTTSFVCKIRL